MWLMVPAGAPVDQTIDLLTPHLAPGDTIIDGGNSYYKDSVRRAAALAQKKIEFRRLRHERRRLGAHGRLQHDGGRRRRRGEAAFADFSRRSRRGRTRAGDAWGRPGSGHFVKMVHNGIEYGIMQAYAEGLDLLRHKKDFGLDLLQISKIWQFGSVIRSWLLDLTVDALTKNPTLEGIGAYVTDSGEGRWTVIEGVELGVPVPVISGALDMRFRSQDPEPFANKLLAMMRHEFGGHAVKTASEKSREAKPNEDGYAGFSRYRCAQPAALAKNCCACWRMRSPSADASRSRWPGGHTPAKLYGLWAEKYKAQTPWDRVHLFWGDERYVPQDDPLSNYRMTRETLISHVPIPTANVHPVPTNLPTPEKAAEAYETGVAEILCRRRAALSICSFSGWAWRGIRLRFFPAPRRWMKSSTGWRQWRCLQSLRNA